MYGARLPSHSSSIGSILYKNEEGGYLITLPTPPFNIGKLHRKPTNLEHHRMRKL